MSKRHFRACFEVFWSVHAQVHAIGSDIDYRMISVIDGEDDRVYIHPNEEREAKILEYKFYKICQGKVSTGQQLEAQGRKILVPKTATTSNVAWFRFSDLCDKPLGAADYLAIGTAFHTVFLADIPKLTLQERDQVRRFITLIDALYDRHTKFLCTAAKDPISLFQVSEEDKKNTTFDEVSFCRFPYFVLEATRVAQSPRLTCELHCQPT